MYLALFALAVLSMSSNVLAQEGKPPKKPKPKVSATAKKPAKRATAKKPAKRTTVKKPAKQRAQRTPKAPSKASTTPGVSSAPEVVVAPKPFQGMLGVMVGKLTPDKRVSLGAPPTAGLSVSKVVPGTIASVAGVQPKDVIIDVAGATIREVTDVRTALSQMNVGDLVTLQVIRRGKPRTLFATLSDETIKPSRFGGFAEYPETGTAKSSLDGKIHFVSSNFVQRRVDRRMRKIKKRIRKLKRRRLHLRKRRSKLRGAPPPKYRQQRSRRQRR